MDTLTDSNKAAIKFSILLGLEIKKYFPEIAEDYRQGLSLNDLVEKYNIKNFFGKKEKVCQMGVLYAIKGYDGQIRLFKLETYSGLIEKNEAAIIGKEHNRKNSKKIGDHFFQEGLGIFKITKEERQKIGQKSGAKLVKEKLGVHAYTHEERKDVGRLGAIAQGKVPYSDEEILYIKELSKKPEFRKGSLIRAREIAIKINEVFHQKKNVRNANSVKKIHSKNKNPIV